MDYPTTALPVLELLHCQPSIDSETLLANLNTFCEEQSQHDSAVGGYIVPLVERFKAAAATTDEMSLEPAATTEEVVSTTASYACNKCRLILFSAAEMHPHNASACTSIFLHEPLEWMEELSDLEGKILCPKCKNKVGSYCWAGIQCSCAAWITPGIKFLKNKLDLKVSS